MEFDPYKPAFLSVTGPGQGKNEDVKQPTYTPKEQLQAYLAKL